MDVKSRVLTCRLLEKMHEQDEYCRKLNISDESEYRQKKIDNENNEVQKENVS